MIRPELNEKELYNLDESIKPKKTFNIDNAFIMKKRGLILNPEYRKFMSGRSIVYEYLWANVIRKYENTDPFHIKDKYYERGFLACCMSYRQIAKECFMSKNTVKQYIKEFKNAGILFIHPINKTHSVFELGRWKELTNGKPQEYNYIDDIFYK
jgi:hypothetical protein